MPIGVYKRNQTICQRFWSKVNKSYSNECWEYQGHIHRFGYGQFNIDGKQIYAHRVAWLLSQGSIPKNLYVLHRCDNRICCNPSHLFLGTYRDNIHDMIDKGREANRKGSKNGRSKLREQDIPLIRALYKAGINQSDIAKMYKVGFTIITDIIHNRRWTHC